MSSTNTFNRIRHTPKTTRAYESSDGDTPSSGRYRSKRNCNNESNENSQRRNKYHPYPQTPVYIDENTTDSYPNENGVQMKTQDKPKASKPSFEEEQQELQKSLSKDWCDKMDNEEAEEKKLHSFVLYLKQFPVHETKTTEELLASIECCPKELVRRQKEISKGKLSKSYQSYISIVPRKSRIRQHPRTPCKYAKMSRRGFDGAIRAWRRKLHEFDHEKNENTDDSISIISSSSSQCSTASSTSMNIEDIDENFLPDLYDFEESLVNENNQLKFHEVDDSMDTIVNTNCDSRSAMAFE